MSSLSLQPQKKAPREATTPSTGDDTPWWQRDLFHLQPTMGGAQKKTFWESLSVLLKAGVPLNDALELLIAQTNFAPRKRVLAQVQADVQAGEPFSAALQKHSGVFGKFEMAMVRVGETGGMLQDTLAELARYHDNAMTLRRKASQLATYPAIVLVIALGVVYFMLSQVVPMFEQVFKQFGATLPALTLWLLRMSEAMREYAWLLTALLIGAVAGVVAMIRSSKAQTIALQAIIWIPLLGTTLRSIQLTRLFMVLSALLSARVKLDEALLLTSDVVGYPPMARSLLRIREQLIQGVSLYDAMQPEPGFPPMVRQMVRVGEKTATLDVMLGSVARNMQQQNEVSVSRLMSLLEPLIILILGSIVGTILLAMYLPMFQLGQGIQ